VLGLGADGLRVLSHLPGRGPSPGKPRGPLGHIAVRPKDLPELHASVRPPGHARPPPGQDTGPTPSGRPRAHTAPRLDYRYG
jgi:hypothetical protein